MRYSSRDIDRAAGRVERGRCAAQFNDCFHITENYAQPAGKLATSRLQRIAVLSWTDSLGPQETTINAATTLGSVPSGGFMIADPSVSRLHVELVPRTTA